MNGTGRSAFAALSGACLLAAAGCAVGPDFVRPGPPAVERYTREAGPADTVAADNQAQRFARGAGVPADWWRLFKSPQLDNVVAQAIANNQGLKSAQASLRQSQELLRAGYGVFYPQVDAAFGAARQRSSAIRFGGSPESTVFNLFTLGATVSYALDVFGGERRAVEGLRAQADFERHTAVAAYLALSGNVVNTVVARAAYREQIEATEQIIAIQKEQILIAETQAQAGIVPYSNVLSLQSQLASTEATLPPLRQKLAQADHLLAVLAGRAPAEWGPPRVDMADLALPEDIPVSLPSDLVRQRPDILAAESQLHGASAEIGVATAALFPSFTLSGSYGQNSSETSELLKSGGNFWSLGANVATPLFRGGTLWYRRKAAIEGYEQALAAYRQTVLGALAQVADTLRALENDALAVQAQSRAVSTAEEALRLIQANYRAGVGTYTQVLIANGQYQQARIGHLQAKAQRFQDTVALFVALGGGWWTGSPSPP